MHCFKDNKIFLGLSWETDVAGWQFKSNKGLLSIALIISGDILWGKFVIYSSPSIMKRNITAYLDNVITYNII